MSGSGVGVSSQGSSSAAVAGRSAASESEEYSIPLYSPVLQPGTARTSKFVIGEPHPIRSVGRIPDLVLRGLGFDSYWGRCREVSSIV